MVSVVAIATVFCVICSISNGADYFVDEHNDCTNFQSVNSAYVTNLGKFNSTQDCINACINKKCDSYSWYNANQGNLAGVCYGYINNTIWLPFPTTKSNCGRIIYNCKTDYDCSLNGKCDTTTGNCTCRTGWNGYKCHFISFLPSNKKSGYFAPYGSYPSTSWGGSIQYDKVTNKYIMLVAVMEYNCGINSWRTNSQIVFASTNDNNWNSEYIGKNAILYAFAHSPDIIYAPDTDEMVLIHVRNTSATGEPTPPCKTCKNGTTASNCNTHQSDSETTTLITISSQDFNQGYDISKWSKPIAIDALGHGDSNFAAVINKDSSLVGMIRGRVISASNWKDNTTYKVLGNPFPYCTSTEDFYVYKDCNGNYHALFHNMDPNDDQALCGAHAYSMDGVNWQYGGLAFSNEVEFTDGTKFTFSRRERPHLIFDSDRCTPVALTSAAEYYHDKSFTLLQPIKK
eukprot:279305_1